MNKTLIILITCLLAGTISFAQFPQVIDCNVSKVNTEEYINVLNLSNVVSGNIASKDAILYGLEAGETGYAEYEVSHLQNSHVILSLHADAGNPSFSIVLQNGAYSIPGTAITNVAFTNGAVFRLQRCLSGVKAILDGSTIYEYPSSIITGAVYGKLELVSSNLSSGNQAKIKFSFPNITPASACAPPAYVKLEKKLDGSYVLPDDQKLHITYTEDYAIVAGENDQVTYKIKNWKNKSVLGGYLTNNYGVNWQDINLPGQPDPGVNVPSTDLEYFYILEVTNISKGETYYLRFKYYYMPEPVPVGGNS